MAERNFRRKDDVNAKRPAENPKSALTEHKLQPDRIVRNPREQKRLNNALFDAVRRADAEVVEKLLEEGADPNARDDMGWTPLMHAAEEGFVTIAKLLMGKGARVDIETEEGWTAEGIAIYGGQTRLANHLKKA